MVDGFGATDSASTTATISNVAPTIDPISDSFIPSGAVLDLLVTFSDPGFLDTWTYDFFWGDGGMTSGSVGSWLPSISISASHTYTGSVDQVFNGFVRITDDDGGTDEASFRTTLIASQVPEPTTLALLSLGLVGLGVARHKKKT